MRVRISDKCPGGFRTFGFIRSGYVGDFASEEGGDSVVGSGDGRSETHVSLHWDERRQVLLKPNLSKSTTSYVTKTALIGSEPDFSQHHCTSSHYESYPYDLWLRCPSIHPPSPPMTAWVDKRVRRIHTQGAPQCALHCTPCYSLLTGDLPHHTVPGLPKSSICCPCRFVQCYTPR
jgi:hypothetical protein